MKWRLNCLERQLIDFLCFLLSSSQISPKHHQPRRRPSPLTSRQDEDAKRGLEASLPLTRRHCDLSSPRVILSIPPDTAITIHMPGHPIHRLPMSSTQPPSPVKIAHTPTSSSFPHPTRLPTPLSPREALPLDPRPHLPPRRALRILRLHPLHLPPPRDHTHHHPITHPPPRLATPTQPDLPLPLSPIPPPPAALHPHPNPQQRPRPRRRLPHPRRHARHVSDAGGHGRRRCVSGAEAGGFEGVAGAGGDGTIGLRTGWVFGVVGSCSGGGRRGRRGVGSGVADI